MFHKTERREYVGWLIIHYIFFGCFVLTYRDKQRWSLLEEQGPVYSLLFLGFLVLLLKILNRLVIFFKKKAALYSCKVGVKKEEASGES
jgi:hypothetical protein